MNDLMHAARNIEQADMDLHRIEIARGGHIEEVYGDQVAAENPHHRAEKSEKGDHEDAREEARRHEIGVGIDGHRSHGIDLLGHFHGAKLGAHGGTDPARDHKSGQDRPEFGDHRLADQNACDAREPLFSELIKRLGRQNETGGKSGDRNDRERHDADMEKLFADQTPSGGPPESRGEDLQDEKRTCPPSPRYESIAFSPGRSSEPLQPHLPIIREDPQNPQAHWKMGIRTPAQSKRGGSSIAGWAGRVSPIKPQPNMT